MYILDDCQSSRMYITLFIHRFVGYFRRFQSLLQWMILQILNVDDHKCFILHHFKNKVWYANIHFAARFVVIYTTGARCQNRNFHQGNVHKRDFATF